MTKKRKLMKPPHPGKFIHENLRELGLNVELAAAAVGVRATTLIDLLTEEELSGRPTWQGQRWPFVRSDRTCNPDDAGF